ncbi:AraC family transcriptional regulator [Paenibacillus agricola]|uniref:AraC family transcriptional regulator n=1 Tax=Paenibacillus agricola TaxID=2716264 RepID=A0ABX0J824_9BACL|nr:AraC family transcriptional regulator [Paenibacillus agricola]NHN32123.1 AraC family transcriptional regulator [Paenibacillus agricola]
MNRIELFDLNTYPFSSVIRRTSELCDSFKETFHAHQGMELQFIHEGKGRLLIDQRSLDIRSGTLCLFQPFQLHRLQPEINEYNRYVRSFVLFEPTVFEPYLQSLPLLHSFYKQLCHGSLQAPILHPIGEEHEFVKTLLAFGEARIEAGAEQHREDAATFLISLLRQLRALLSDPKRLPLVSPRPAHRAEQMMQWIEQHYTEAFRLAALAEELHMSPYYVSHIFQETTGSSLSEYLKARRIRQACVLLTSSEQSVTEIGESVGLGNTSYFCRTFKDAKGQTPHQYRLQWKKSNV